MKDNGSRRQDSSFFLVAELLDSGVGGGMGNSSFIELALQLLLRDVLERTRSADRVRASSGSVRAACDGSDWGRRRLYMLRVLHKILLLSLRGDLDRRVPQQLWEYMR